MLYLLKDRIDRVVEMVDEFNKFVNLEKTCQISVIIISQITKLIS